MTEYDCEREDRKIFITICLSIFFLIIFFVKRCGDYTQDSIVKKKYLKKSLKILNQEIANNPNVDKYKMRALVKKDLGFYVASLEDVSKALKTNPERVDLLELREELRETLEPSVYYYPPRITTNPFR